jgi:hypothetical protein
MRVAQLYLSLGSRRRRFGGVEARSGFHFSFPLLFATQPSGACDLSPNEERGWRLLQWTCHLSASNLISFID